MNLRIIITGSLLLALFAASGAALPPSCSDPCTVLAATPGFVPAAVSVESGTEVLFQSIDITHPVGEAAAGMDTCFLASSSASTTVDPVTFTWDGSELRADGKVCTMAQTLPTGEGMLAFMCFLHPNMIGVLTVT